CRWLSDAAIPNTVFSRGAKAYTWIEKSASNSLQHLLSINMQILPHRLKTFCNIFSFLKTSQSKFKL
ncbi:hypothetical protein ABVT39_012345, partial [Epinephelus coioides]